MELPEPIAVPRPMVVEHKGERRSALERFHEEMQKAVDELDEKTKQDILARQKAAPFGVVFIPGSGYAASRPPQNEAERLTLLSLIYPDYDEILHHDHRWAAHVAKLKAAGTKFDLIDELKSYLDDASSRLLSIQRSHFTYCPPVLRKKAGNAFVFAGVRPVGATRHHMVIAATLHRPKGENPDVARRKDDLCLYAADVRDAGDDPTSVRQMHIERESPEVTAEVAAAIDERFHIDSPDAISVAYRKVPGSRLPDSDFVSAAARDSVALVLAAEPDRARVFRVGGPPDVRSEVRNFVICRAEDTLAPMPAHVALSPNGRFFAAAYNDARAGPEGEPLPPHLRIFFLGGEGVAGPAIWPVPDAESQEGADAESVLTPAISMLSFNKTIDNAFYVGTDDGEIYTLVLDEAGPRVQPDVRRDSYSDEMKVVAGRLVSDERAGGPPPAEAELPVQVPIFYSSSIVGALGLDGEGKRRIEPEQRTLSCCTESFSFACGAPSGDPRAVMRSSMGMVPYKRIPNTGAQICGASCGDVLALQSAAHTLTIGLFLDLLSMDADASQAGRPRCSTTMLSPLPRTAPRPKSSSPRAPSSPTNAFRPFPTASPH